MSKPREKAVSLHSIHPWRFDVPFGIVLTGALFAFALYQPALHTTVSIPTSVPIPVPDQTETFSVVTGIEKLFAQGHDIPAYLILAFSVVFPFLKLFKMLVIWFTPVRHHWRTRMLHLLGIIGKWSMVDVFVIAVILVISTVTKPLDATAGIGIYLFGGAVILSMVQTFYLEHLARMQSKKEVERDAAIAGASTAA